MQRPPSNARCAAAPPVDHRGVGARFGEQLCVDRGAGVFSSAFGLLMFLVFLLFAVQVLFSLYATSVVTGAGYDAGRHLARTGDAAGAAQRFDQTIGDYDAAVRFSFEGGTGLADADVIVVTITGENPTVLPDRFARTLPFGTVDRTLRITNETFVEAAP